MNCSSYKGVKLLKHSVKFAEKSTGKKKEVDLDSMQLGFMLSIGIIKMLCFVLQRSEEEYQEKDKKLY